jgi:hypothetical protein
MLCHIQDSPGGASGIDSSASRLAYSGWLSPLGSQVERFCWRAGTTLFKLRSPRQRWDSYASYAHRLG